MGWCRSGFRGRWGRGRYTKEGENRQREGQEGEGDLRYYFDFCIAIGLGKSTLEYARDDVDIDFYLNSRDMIYQIAYI